MTQQPIWEFVANLGDINIADYGGFIVYRDTTGVYLPEVELYEPNDEGEENGGTVYQFQLSPPRFKSLCGQWHREWFARKDKLESAVSTCGITAFSLLRQLASKDPVERASGYQVLIATYGPGEFDSYPLALTEEEAQERYADASKLSRTALDGR
jgi:hypothetical protein